MFEISHIKSKANRILNCSLTIESFVLGFAPQGGARAGVEVHVGGQGRQLPRGQRRPDRPPVQRRDREKDGEVSG